MKKYVFKPYSKIFPELFQKESKRIASSVNRPVVIEHIGSTSVPGLGGKGIIDIAIAVDKKNMESVSEQIQAIGYEFRPKGSTSDRLYFITYLADPEEENRRYHIHLTYPENREWKDFLGFRDYLRNHPKETKEYAELKEQAALEADGEGEKYRKLKEPIFQRIHSEIYKTDSLSIALKRQAEIKDITIHMLEKADMKLLINDFSFPWSSVQATTDKWTRYYDEQQIQIRTVYMLKKAEKIVGYASLLYVSQYPNFKNASVPEINDVWIAKDWRNKGLGKTLIQYLEQAARIKGYQQIGIGVGLYADYGAAQKLYFQLGYAPDGHGITYNFQPTVPGESYPLDDELVLWMTKKLY